MVKEYVAKHQGILSQSFSRNILICWIYDILFYGLVILGFFVFLLALQFGTNTIESMNFSDMLKDSALALETYHNLKVFLMVLVISIPLFLLYLIFTFSIIKALIWMTYLKKRLSFRFFLKFFFMQLLYFIPMITAYLYIALGLHNKKLLMLLVLIHIHLNSHLCIAFAKTQSIKLSFSKLMSSWYRMDIYTIPYLLIAFLMYISVTFLDFLQPIRTKFSIFLTFGVVLIIASWGRNYILQMAATDG